SADPKRSSKASWYAGVSPESARAVSTRNAMGASRKDSGRNPPAVAPGFTAALPQAPSANATPSRIPCRNSFTSPPKKNDATMDNGQRTAGHEAPAPRRPSPMIPHRQEYYI